MLNKLNFVFKAISIYISKKFFARFHPVKNLVKAGLHNPGTYAKRI